MESKPSESVKEQEQPKTHKITKKRRPLTKLLLEKYMHLSPRSAASQLNVSLSNLYKTCRNLGLKWPKRKDRKNNNLKFSNYVPVGGELVIQKGKTLEFDNLNLNVNVNIVSNQAPTNQNVVSKGPQQECFSYIKAGSADIYNIHQNAFSELPCQEHTQSCMVRQQGDMFSHSHWQGNKAESGLSQASDHLCNARMLKNNNNCNLNSNSCNCGHTVQLLEPKIDGFDMEPFEYKINQIQEPKRKNLPILPSYKDLVASIQQYHSLKGTSFSFEE